MLHPDMPSVVIVGWWFIAGVGVGSVLGHAQGYLNGRADGRRAAAREHARRG